MFGEDEIVRSHKGRIAIIGNLILFCFTIILARLWYLQIYKGEQLYQYSLSNRLRKENIDAPRGMVFSRNNKLLVHNIPRFDAVIIPQYLRFKEESIQKLSSILDMKVTDIKKVLKKNSGQARYRPVIVKKNISRKEVAIIETENAKMPGVLVKTFISREYGDKEIGGHLFGYISEISQKQLPRYRKRDKFDYKLGDFIGQAGIEEEFDLFLRGADGFEFMEVDARGRMKRHIAGADFFSDIKNKNAEPGNNIRLTIDRDMQKTAYDSLEGKVGSVVALKVDTGEVMTMVSRPSFNPARFSKGLTPEYWSELNNNEQNPLIDRTIQEHYAPGSVFKTITAIAALEEGLINEKTKVHCPGWFRLGRRKFHCWIKYGHKKVNVVESLRESCDVFYYKIGTMLDIDTLAKYAKMFGLGEKTGISLPRETSGLIPTKEWKLKRNGQPWQKGETLSCVIGQSFVLTTPLQLALSYSAIANQGKLYRPRVIKEVFSNDGKIVKQDKPELLNTIQLKPKTMELIKKGLIEVVNHPKGTARGSRGSGIRMAGKTGTSQVMSFTAEKLFSKCDEKDYEQRHHAVFTAYAPHDDPKIAVSVVVEHGCSGSRAAAPVARNVVTTYMKKYFPDLQKSRAREDRVKYLQKLKEIEKEKEKKI